MTLQCLLLLMVIFWPPAVRVAPPNFSLQSGTLSLTFAAAVFKQKLQGSPLTTREAALRILHSRLVEVADVTLDVVQAQHRSLVVVAVLVLPARAAAQLVLDHLRGNTKGVSDIMRAIKDLCEKTVPPPHHLKNSPIYYYFFFFSSHSSMTFLDSCS